MVAMVHNPDGVSFAVETKGLKEMEAPPCEELEDVEIVGADVNVDVDVEGQNPMESG